MHQLVAYFPVDWHAVNEAEMENKDGRVEMENINGAIRM